MIASNDMKRKKRNSCVYSRGVTYYNFDFEREFAIYKYLCGEKITKRQWEYIDDDNSFEFYSQWENYVRQRYQDCEVSKLSEFRKYLRHRKRKMEPQNFYWNVAFSALMGCFLADGVKVLLNDMSMLNELLKGIMPRTMILLFAFILCVATIGVLLWLIMAYLEKIFTGDLKKYFFDDYDYIIQKLLRERV